MNKNAIKSFATWARAELIAAVTQKAYEYDVTKDGLNQVGLDTIQGRVLSSDEKWKRDKLINQINEKGFDQVMEEAAYIWFNRFIALRFMEVNGYLPSKVRVFTNENNEFKPDMLKEATTLELAGIDKDIVFDYIDKQDNEGLYKYLLILQCNELSGCFPEAFQSISNYIELLYPNNLLNSDSVLGRMISDIPEEDWTDQVQIIGWLYQYYNSELKDDTFAKLKKNVKISKDRIPAATQLFTPDWIVRYMVENSLGRLWLEGHPECNLKENWKYYLDEAEQEPEVQAQLDQIREEYKMLKPEDIKVIDPCMGSGHILVYAFDVLMQIYTYAGWSERDAAKSILENNLYGLDIDDRAGQLASFSVMMKARQYNRRILNEGIKLNVLSIQESNEINKENLNVLGDCKEITVRLIDAFVDAKEYGSILNINFKKDELDALDEKLQTLKDDLSFSQITTQLLTKELIEQLKPLVHQARIMSQQYEVVVTNPPYMGSDSMSDKLKNFSLTYYSDSRYDLYAICVEKFIKMGKKIGYISMITQHSFLYAYCFRNFRSNILKNANFINAVHLGPHAFEEISGEVVQCISFTISPRHIAIKAPFVPLVKYTSEKEKYFYQQKPIVVETSDFSDFENMVFAYSMTSKMKELYMSNQKIGNVFDSKAGVVTGKDEYFLRNWYEISFPQFDLNAKDTESKYVPYSKGGSFVKWYGNITFALRLKDLYTDVLVNKSVRRGDKNTYFKKCIGWSQMGGGNEKNFSILESCICGTATPTILQDDDDKTYYVLGFLNSAIPPRYIESFNPLLSTYIGDICNLPFVKNDEQYRNVIILVKSNISISKVVWDSHETSWDYKKHPLI